MKTRLFIAIISVTCLLQPTNAQTSYMPVFGDTTRYYSSIEGVDGSQFGYNDYIKVNDSTSIPIEGDEYPQIVVAYHLYVENATHSKIWGIDTLTTYFPARRDLLMDLDLNLGDTYIDPDGYTHIVDSVYTKDGRKHIRFENMWGDYDIYLEYYARHGHEGIFGFLGKLQVEFIEGVGSNTSFYPSLGAGPEIIPWLCAQYKNGKLSYQPPGFMPLPDVLAGNTSINATGQLIRLSPVPVSNVLTLELPETISLNNVRYDIIDTNGRSLQNGMVQNRNFVIDISKNSSGIYFLQLRKRAALLATKTFIKL